jgi:hypothetical protein
LLLRSGLLIADDNAVLVDDGAGGRFVLPTSSVQPCGGVLGVARLLAGPLNRIALGARDQRFGLNAAPEGGYERLGRRLLGNARG